MAFKKKLRLLCVDDDPPNIGLYEAVFSPLGFDVLTAENGDEAWAKVEKEPLDAILTDVMMPKVNGFDLCKKIKDDERFAHIPVLLVTALKDKKSRLRGITVGADDFFTKPVDREMLVARVISLASRKPQGKIVQPNMDALTKSFDRMETWARLLDAPPQDFRIQHDLLVKDYLHLWGEGVNRPQYLLWGMSDEATWEWFLYEFHFNEVSCKSLDAPLEKLLRVSSLCDFRFVQARTGSEIGTAGLSRFVEKMDSFSGVLKITNLLGFIGKKSCLFGLNYSPSLSLMEFLSFKTLAISGHIMLSTSTLARESASSIEEFVSGLVRASETLETADKNHPCRVGEYCALIAEALGLASAFVQEIRIQARIHDVGNLLIPPAVLHKSGKLNFEEWEIVRKHPLYGGHIIGDHPRLAMAKTIALAHHENWDGTGYPHWLEGERIPIEGRIAMIADRYDAMRIPRPYKEAMDHAAVCRLIVEGDDRINPKHLDPTVLAAFKQCAPLFSEIFEKYQKSKSTT